MSRGARVGGVLVAVVLGMAGSCGRVYEPNFGVPAVCEDAPRKAGEPSPSAVGRCDELSASAPLFGCSDGESCELPILRCDPTRDTDGATHRCCSDDPATVDGGTPRYEGRAGTGGKPLFSGSNNAQGTSGVCVRTEFVDDGLREAPARDCPVPCNPTWSDPEIGEVCGDAKVCCQTVRTEPKDCIFDELESRWRAVRGTDIAVREPSGTVRTNWAARAHATQQDPGGLRCAALAGVDSNDSTDPAYLNCIRRLTVADQRGFCTAPEDCCVSDAYLDTCERLN